jgi:ribosomal protein L11 methyltransferase
MVDTEGYDQRWIEISVVCDRDAADDLTSLFGRYCRGGAVVEERCPEIGQAPSDGVAVKGYVPVNDQETSRKLEIALLLLSRNSRISEPVLRALEPEDWSESWKAYFTPQHIGERTVIVPSWHSYDPQPGEVILHLDPGMAFGTGLHATTRLCLVALERLAQPGMRVLDVGTGSGILGIAAALQGAAAVDAVDNDPVCVDVTRENIRRNGVSGQMHVALGTLGYNASADLPCHQGTEYDLLLINILAEIIIGMAPALPATLSAGGQFVASGIIGEKAGAVAEALQAVGLQVDERLSESDWVALIGHKT